MRNDPDALRPDDTPDSDSAPVHHTDPIPLLYGADPLTYIATPTILIEDLNADPDPIPDTEPAVPSLEPADTATIPDPREAPAS